jgi:hypothetical protein
MSTPKNVALLRQLIARSIADSNTIGDYDTYRETARLQAELEEILAPDISKLEEIRQVLAAVHSEHERFGGRFPDGFNSRVFVWLRDTVCQQPAPGTPAPAVELDTFECYSTSGEDYSQDTLGEALADLEPGDTLHIGTAVRRLPSAFFHVDTLLDNMGDAASDEAGEHADGFPNLPKDKIADLKRMVGSWLDANLTVDFWTVRNTREVTVTQAMIDSGDLQDQDLPEGVFDRDGKHFATCVGCERDTEILCDIREIPATDYRHYCGGGPRCCP